MKLFFNSIGKLDAGCIYKRILSSQSIRLPPQSRISIALNPKILYPAVDDSLCSSAQRPPLVSLLYWTGSDTLLHVFAGGGWIHNVIAEEFHVQNWRREDGLPNGQITTIEQTSDGYLWAGTPKGLARFDGRQFKIFKAGGRSGFSDSRISSLITDHEGTLLGGNAGCSISRLTETGFMAIQSPVPLILPPDLKPVSDTWLCGIRSFLTMYTNLLVYNQLHDRKPLIWNS